MLRLMLVGHPWLGLFLLLLLGHLVKLLCYKNVVNRHRWGRLDEVCNWFFLHLDIRLGLWSLLDLRLLSGFHFCLQGSMELLFYK